MIRISFNQLDTTKKKEMIKWCSEKFGESQSDPRGLVVDKRWTYDSVGSKMFFFFCNDNDHMLFALRWF